MSSNKKFRIQNGAAITGEVTVNDQVVITEAGIVTVPAISAAVATIVASDIATLQSQVDAILGTSPESLNTLQEIVSLFQSEDGDIQTLITNNSTAITAMQATLSSGVAGAADFAALDLLVLGLHGRGSELVNGIGHTQWDYIIGYINTSPNFVQFTRNGDGMVARKVLTGFEVGKTYQIRTSGDQESAYVTLSPQAYNNYGDFNSSSFKTAFHNHSPGTGDVLTDSGTTFVADATTLHMQIVGNTQNAFRLYDISITEYNVAPALETSSGSVVESINELHTEIGAEAAARTAAIAAIPATDLTPYSTTAQMDSSIATAKSEAQTYADQVVASTIDAAPAALDTLNELAAALGDDANFASTVTTALATKADDAATTTALATKADDAATTTALATKADVSSISSIEGFLNGTPSVPTISPLADLFTPAPSDYTSWDADDEGKLGSNLGSSEDFLFVSAAGHDGSKGMMWIYPKSDMSNPVELTIPQYYGGSPSFGHSYAFSETTKTLMVATRYAHDTVGAGTEGALHWFNLTDVNNITLIQTVYGAPGEEIGQSAEYDSGNFFSSRTGDGGGQVSKVYVYDETNLSAAPTVILDPETEASSHEYFGYRIVAGQGYLYILDLFAYADGSNTQRLGRWYIYDSSTLAYTGVSFNGVANMARFGGMIDGYFVHGIDGSYNSVGSIERVIIGTDTVVTSHSFGVGAGGIQFIDDTHLWWGTFGEISSGYLGNVKAYPWAGDFTTSDITVNTDYPSGVIHKDGDVVYITERNQSSASWNNYAAKYAKVSRYSWSSGFSLQSNLESLVSAETTARTAAIAAIPATDLTPYSTTAQTTAAIAAETSARTAAIAAIPGTDLTPYSTTTEMNSSIATAKSEAQTYADQVVAATVDAAPAALDTLNELAAALGDDANFASTVTASIATKATAADLTALEAQITGGVATLSQGALADTALQPADLVANTTAIATNASNLTALETSHSADLVNLTARTYGVTYDPNAANVEVDSTLDMQTNAIINVAAPSAADDAATKAYVDAGQVAAISASAAALSGGLCITYDPATGEIKIDTVETASSLLVADSNNLGSQAPSHYRIDVYNVNGTIVN